MTDYYLSQDENNFASVIGLQIALADEVEFVDTDKSTQTYGNVNFESGKDFLEIYITPGKSKVDIRPRQKNGNKFYQVKLVAYHPKDRQPAAEKLFEINRHRVLARYKTANTVVKLIGTHEEHAEISIEPLNSGADGYDGYEITIEGEFSNAPYIEA